MRSLSFVDAVEDVHLLAWWPPSRVVRILKRTIVVVATNSETNSERVNRFMGNSFVVLKSTYSHRRRRGP